MAVLTVRDVPEGVKDALARCARKHGQSLQAFVLGVLEREPTFGRNRELLTEIDRELAQSGGADADVPDAADLITEARERRKSTLSDDNPDEM